MFSGLPPRAPAPVKEAWSSLGRVTAEKLGIPALEWETAAETYTAAHDPQAEMAAGKGLGLICKDVNDYRISQLNPKEKLLNALTEATVEEAAERPETILGALGQVVESVADATEAAIDGLAEQGQEQAAKQIGKAQKGLVKLGKTITSVGQRVSGTVSSGLSQGLKTTVGKAKEAAHIMRGKPVEQIHNDFEKHRRYLKVAKAIGKEAETVNMLNEYGHRLSTVSTRKQSQFKNRQGTLRVKRTPQNGMSNLSPEAIRDMNVNNDRYGLYPGQFHLPLKHYYILKAANAPETVAGGKRKTKRHAKRRHRKTRRHL